MAVCTDLTAYAHFIYEARTVGSVLKRELSMYPANTVLLMLERAWLIDLTNHTVPGALCSRPTNLTSQYLANYQSRDLHVSVLMPSTLAYPPNGELIPLMWAQERNLLYPLEWYHRVLANTVPVKLAASHFWIRDLLLAHPGGLTLGFKDCPVVVEGCCPTNEVAYMFFSGGMKCRIGNNPQPSTTLLLHHIIWINSYFERTYRSVEDDNIWINICHPTLTHLLPFVGWLHAVETFGIQWQDLTIVDPHLVPMMGLPFNVGVILVKHLDQTRSAKLPWRPVWL
jgi:hypothetical protein